MLYELYAAALDAMKAAGPSALGIRIEFEAKLRKAEALAAPAALIEHLTAAQIGDRILTRLRLALATWDADTLGPWGEGTAPPTEARRIRVYDLLELDDELRACFDRAMPVATDDAVVVSREFKPWYGRVMAERQPYYEPPACSVGGFHLPGSGGQSPPRVSMASAMTACGE